MNKYQIIVVDDQRDVRRTLRAGLETLSPDLQIQDVPSAEEAILLASRNMPHLIIVDVRLAGMSGLDLVKKIHKSGREIKIILITGVTDAEMRQQVAQAGADAYFFKPVAMDDFLGAVEKLLNLPTQPEYPREVDLQPEIAPIPSMARNWIGQLQNWLTEIQADCLMALDSDGRVVARAGQFPLGLDERSLLAVLPVLLNGSYTLTNALGSTMADGGSFFLGARFDLCVVQSKQAVLAAFITANQSDEVSRVTSLSEAFRFLHSHLNGNMLDAFNANPTRVEETQHTPAPEERLGELDSLFNQVGKNDVDHQDITSFWREAGEASGDNSLGNGTIPYEQAKQLGLTPQDTKSSE